MKPGSLAPAGAIARRRIELAFLPAALEVIDTPASPTARYTAAAIAAFFTAAVTWSILGHVDIIATAPGTVIPAGKTKTVQPLEAGVVKSILVQDGDHVRAGQTLVELDVVAAAAERDRYARDLRRARLDVAGLQALREAFAGGEPLDRFAPPTGLPAAEIEIERAAIVARHAGQREKLADLAQQVLEKEAEAGENAASISRLQALLPIAQQKRDLYRSLLNVQFTNKTAWLDAEAAYTDDQSQLLVQQRKTPEVLAQAESLRRQLASARADYVKGVLQDLADAGQKQGELEQQVAEAAHKAEQTVLSAPIDGTVQQLAIHTIGGVVTPAQPLMQVVPDGGPVLIEARVKNRDIGFVSAGQPVEVKVETFQFTQYGLLTGHVLDVSHDAVPQTDKRSKQDGKDGRQVENDNAPDADPSDYIAHVALDQTKMFVDGHEHKISAGMSVTTEIRTGRRRLISFLLAPFEETLLDSAGER
jgi:hemolysin D